MRDLLLGIIAYLLCGALYVLVTVRSAYQSWTVRTYWLANVTLWPVALGYAAWDWFSERDGVKGWLFNYSIRHARPRSGPDGGGATNG